jgi:endoglucanase
MSVSGFEKRAGGDLCRLFGEHFDEIRTDAVGNHLFIKKCGRENAPTILVDAHFDEIGMMVTGYKNGGFLKVTNVGGVDTRLLPSSEVVIYGKETIPGVFATTPESGRRWGDDSLKPIDQLVIDTGYSDDEIKELCPLGTPVGYKGEYHLLKNDKLVGKAFDDKACGACAVYGIDAVDNLDMMADVYFVFATREEIGCVGAGPAAYGIDPDYALVLDVTNSWIPEMTGMKWTAIGTGISIDISPVTNRKLTKMTAKLCEEKGIKFTLRASPGSTGTDANATGTVREGIPTVLCSLPLRTGRRN